ncbi:unnamed protein product, partial [Lymnaea stagnalis]
NRFCKITSCADCSLHVHLVVFDNELYACGQKSITDTTNKVFVFRRNKWTKVIEITGIRLFLLSYENSILVLNKERKIVSLLKPEESYRLKKNFETLPEKGTFEYALIYGSKLLVFLAENVEGVEETAVHCLDLINKTWTKLDNLKGPAKHLISFQDDETNYIIQRNGNVWRLVGTKDKLVSFKFIGKLWTADRILHGAVLYKDQLTLHGDSPKNYPKATKLVLNEFPYSLNYWGRNGASSNFLPVILAKSCLIS